MTEELSLPLKEVIGMGGGTILKVGGTSAHQKTMENFCGLN